MQPNKELPQIREISDLLQKAREYGIQSLNRIETLNSYATQIHGRHTFIQNGLMEQTQLMQILSEQNPQLEILRSAKDRLDEMLSHSLALSQLNEKSLEILDLSANEAIQQGKITKASSLLKSILTCLDLIESKKLEVFLQTTENNQDAGSIQGSPQDLQRLKNHIKG